MGIKYDTDTIKLINLFEKVSDVKVKDCLVNENIIFIVNKGYMGKAIGRNGVKIKKVEDLIKKKIKVVEFSDDVCKFIKNFLAPLKIEEVSIDDNKKLVSIKVNGISIKAKIIGRNNKNLNNLKKVVSRYFKIDSIRVV